MAMAGIHMPAMAESYYEMRLKDEPSGVYEWAEQGLLFVQVRVPREAGDAAEDIEGRILAAEQEELFAWLASQASAERQDPELSPGMAFARDIVRSEYPLWEYVSDWEGSFNGPHFARYEMDERVCCAVYDKSEVLATMPKSFMVPVGLDVWKRGVRELFQEKYSGKVDRSFMWQVCLLDVLELSLLKDNGSVASWAQEFVLDDSAAYEEYMKVQKERMDYLEESDTARFMKAEKLRLETLPDKISYEWDPARPESEDTRECLVVTNVIGECEFEVVTTETKTCRSVRKLHKRVTPMAVDPVFEKLFLSGGSMANTPKKRTPAGVAAEKSFYASGKFSSRQREKILIEALRENPGDKVLWNLLGRVMLARRDLHGGLICYRNSLMLDGQYEFALANLAIVYRDLGCSKLSYGAAMAAFGIASDSWCRNESAKILEGTR